GQPPKTVEPQSTAPIVLHYRESPIFAGPHEHAVKAIVFSADGASLATGSNDGYVRIWDAQTGQLKSIFGDDATRGINSLAYSPNGDVIAAVGLFFGADVKWWSVSSGRIA